VRSLRAAPSRGIAQATFSTLRACLRGKTSVLQTDGSGATPDSSTKGFISVWLNLARALRLGRRGWGFESLCGDRSHDFTTSSSAHGSTW
jgi:hypothetical protein